MEQAFPTNFSPAPFLASKAPYFLAVGFMVLGLFEAWWVYSLHAQVLAAREMIRTRDWQVNEASESRALADFRVESLEPKDAAYASAEIAVAWNAHLHQGMVSVHKLPAAPAGRVYQLWVLDPGEQAPVNAGLLAVTEGSQSFAVHPVTMDRVGFAVSLEPAGGSVEPKEGILFAVAPGQE